MKHGLVIEGQVTSLIFSLLLLSILHFYSVWELDRWLTMAGSLFLQPVSDNQT